MLVAVRDAWEVGANGITHLPVGFGAHHWRVDDRRVTDACSSPSTASASRHSAESLEAAYTGAIQLSERGLEFVLAPLRSRTGRVLVPVATGALSCTPWVDGVVVGEGAIVDPETAEDNIVDLDRLHAAAAPTGLSGGRRWTGPISVER